MSMIVEAIQRLRPGIVGWALDGNDIKWVERLDRYGEPTGIYDATNLTWSDHNNPMPSKQEFDDMLVQLEKERRNNEYQIYRKFEYPPLQELADAIYWQSKGNDSKMEEYLAKVEEVKNKYPKKG